MKFGERVSAILGIYKSIYWNLKLFGIRKGLRLPILFGSRCKVVIDKSSSVTVPELSPFGSIKIGVNYGPFDKGQHSKTQFILKNNATVTFKGKCNINAGGTINIISGKCTLGDNFAANACFLLSCEKQISIGDNVLFGWDCTVIDGDGHMINDVAGHCCNEAESIYIGNHVWVAAHASILKGTKISNDSVVGYGSIVTKKFSDNGIIIAGSPAKIVKEQIAWKR